MPFFVVADARTISIDGKEYIIMTEEDLRQFVLIGEENHAMKREIEVLNHAVKKNAESHNELVTKVGDIAAAYQAACTTRDILIGISIVTALTTIGGILLW